MKIKIKPIIDITMFILIIFLMNTNFMGIKLHEILGISIFILFTLHKILNFKWIKSI